MNLVQPLKWHGGKHYLANKIIELMPPRTEYLHYVEPYFGGGAVLLANDPDGISEVVNDINGGLINFWEVLRDEVNFKLLKRALEATPFSEATFKVPSISPSHYPLVVEMARVFFIKCRLSLAGRMKGFTSITKTRVRRGMNNEVSAWLTVIDGLPEVHTRLKRVLILNQDAIKVVIRQDGHKTLFYLDPPYMHSTRVSTEAYAYEMTDDQHQELLITIRRCNGKVMLSGYHSPLYDDILSDWKCHEFSTPNAAAGGKNKRIMVECLWCNY